MADPRDTGNEAEDQALQALNRAGSEIIARLPKARFTRPDEAVSYYISEADLVRLRHAGSNSGLSAWAQFVGGGALGAAPSGVIGILNFAGATKALDIDKADIVNSTIFLGLALATLILVLVNWHKDNETVAAVCKEIVDRPKSDL